MQNKKEHDKTEAQVIATKAVKISLLACVIMIVFASLSLWVLFNQITATANLVKMQKEYEIRLEKLEKNLNNR